MWSTIFSAAAGAWFWYGELIVGHLMLALGVIMTGYLQGAVFRVVLVRAYDDRNIQAEMIRASDLDWIVARPTFLTAGPRPGATR